MTVIFLTRARHGLRSGFVKRGQIFLTAEIWTGDAFGAVFLL
jgi:hypothetical protein